MFDSKWKNPEETKVENTFDVRYFSSQHKYHVSFSADRGLKCQYMVGKLKEEKDKGGW